MHIMCALALVIPGCAVNGLSIPKERVDAVREPEFAWREGEGGMSSGRCRSYTKIPVTQLGQRFFINSRSHKMQ